MGGGGLNYPRPRNRPRTTSRHDTWSGGETARAESKEIVPCGINSDAATQLADGRITGYRALPAPRRMYHTMMMRAIRMYQMLKRCGFSARNWPRLQCVSGNWGEADNRPSPTRGSEAGEYLPVEHQVSAAGERLPVEHWDTRRGAHDATHGEAFEVDRRHLISQEVFYSKMKYAKTTHKIDILTESLIDGTRRGYRRSWWRWMSFCRGHNLSVWMGSKEGRWGENLMNSY